MANIGQATLLDKLTFLEIRLLLHIPTCIYTILSISLSANDAMRRLASASANKLVSKLNLTTVISINKN